MDLCVMWIPRKHVFSVKSKVRVAMLILVYAVLVIIAILRMRYGMEVNACPAIHLMMLVVDLMIAVMMLFVKLFLGKGGFVYLNRTSLDLDWTWT